MLDESKRRLSELEPEVDDLAEALGVSAKRRRLEELETRSSKAEFYDDPESSAKIFSEMSGLRDSLAQYEKLRELLADAQTLLELWEEGDEGAAAECEEAVKNLGEQAEKMRLWALLTGEYDKNNAILTFHAGAGGKEAQDWVEMLLRMYQRWAADHGYKTTIMDYLAGEDAGVKSASVLVAGENAYGFLKSENGVHRLVRVSPFDSSGRRHTSFASLEVMPEIDKDVNIEIREEDIQMDVYRASGAGGQKVNKTSSCVQLRHRPSGIEVKCQRERSQTMNRFFARRELCDKLEEHIQGKASQRSKPSKKSAARSASAPSARRPACWTTRGIMGPRRRCDAARGRWTDGFRRALLYL